MIGQSLAIAGAISVLILGIVLAVVTAVLAKLSGDEVSGWLPVWTNSLLESAASVVPAEHRDRYREEWKGELAAFRERRLSGLRFAWRLRRRARSVSVALVENAGIGEVFEQAEPAPTGSRPLDPEAIAEIVRRVVERTQPRHQRRFAEILEEMREIVGDIRRDEAVSSLTNEYVGDISELRRQARERPSLPAMSARHPVPITRPPRLRLADEDHDLEEWGSDYDSDWSFLPDSRDRARMRREQLQASMGTRLRRAVRSWLRGEIRL